jgi:AcrR family transcriptional regulator
MPAEWVAATQRERLLDGVARTVAEHGYAGARISDICRAAGVTRPVFYELFTGKEDAVLSAYRAGTALVVARMEEAYQAAGGAADWPAAVRAGLRAALELLAATPPFAAMLVEIEAVGPVGRQARARLLAQFRRFFADAPPGPRGVPEAELTDAVIGAVHNAMYRRIDEGRVSELPGLLDTVTYLAVTPYWGDTGTPSQRSSAK